MILLIDICKSAKNYLEKVFRNQKSEWGNINAICNNIVALYPEKLFKHKNNKYYIDNGENTNDYDYETLKWRSEAFSKSSSPSVNMQLSIISALCYEYLSENVDGAIVIKEPIEGLSKKEADETGIPNFRYKNSIYYYVRKEMVFNYVDMREALIIGTICSPPYFHAFSVNRFSIGEICDGLNLGKLLDYCDNAFFGMNDGDDYLIVNKDLNKLTNLINRTGVKWNNYYNMNVSVENII